MNKIALIVLSYNVWKVTERFLNTLYKNTEISQFKLYFIDNGSIDTTPDKLKYFSTTVENMTVHLNDKNEGVIGGRNQGFDWFFNNEECKDCNYIMFLDNDQFVQKGWLEHHLSIMDRGYDIVGVEAWQMNNYYMPIKKIVRLNEWFTYVGCGGMMIKREAAISIGKFDKIFNPSYFEDPDYVFRAIDEDFKIGWDYKTKIIHLPHQTLGNADNKQQRFINSMYKFKNKWKKRKPIMLRQINLPEFNN